jgi:putative uncharacterized protein (fragment)|nr:MAG TPA: hypothetical protein [Caudoviricetes sp.]
MNARSFLGDEKIGALMQQGYSPEQITNYAKTEYYKQQGAQQASLTPQQNTAAVQPAAQNIQQTQGYTRVPIRDEQTGEVVNSAPKLGLDGRPIPAAPTPGRSEEARANEKKSKFLGGALDGLGMEAKTILDNSFFGSGEPAKSKDEILKDRVAKASSRSLFQTIAGDEKDATELQKDLDYIAKNAGYDLGAVQTSDGKIYFGTRGADGRIIQKEVTPSLWDDLAARKTEIAGGVVGAGLAPFTGGASLVPMLAMSAGGSAIGSMNDLRQKGEATGREYDASDYASRALQAAGEDALGGVAVAGAGKLIKAAAPAIKQAGERIISPVAKNAAKIADNNILVNLMRRGVTDNIEGAEAQYIKSMGGEAEALKNLAASKNALGEEGFKNFANAERSLQIPKTGNEAIDKSINYINEKGIKPAEQTIRRVIQGENLNEREANLLASALSNDKGADLITRSVAGDADAFAKTQKIMTNLNSSFAKNINESFKDAPNVVQVFKDYEARTKNDFGNVIKTLDNEFGTLGLDTRALSARVGEALENTLPKGSQITKYAMKGIQKGGLEGLQDARAFLNGEISTLKKANDALSRERLLELREARGIIDDAIDSTLDQFSQINPEVGARAKELMQTARADYSAYKEIEQSDLFKRLTRGMKNTNDLTSALLKSADNQTGLNLDEVLSVLNPAERANVEGGLLKNIIERNTKEGITDFKAALEQIDQIPFKSERVAGAIDQLKESAPILKNSGEILKKLSEMTPKTAELQQGIGKSITGAFQVMLRNRLVNKLKSKIPWYGNNQALKNHIVNALKNAGDLEGTIKNIEAIPTEGLDSATKDGLNKFVKEVVPEIRQILKTQEDDAVRAKFNPEKLRKSLIDPNLTTQEKVNLVEMAKKQIKEELDEKAGKKAIDKMQQAVFELQKVDYKSLNDTQKGIYDVFMGNKSTTTLKVTDMDDLISLEQGSRKAGARKIMIKHGGLDKTGGLNGDELVDIENVLLRGKIDKNSFEMRDKSLRYAYDLKKDGVNLKVVVDEFNDGKKVFDYYSDRNFINKKVANIKQQPDPNATFNGIIPQNSQKVKELPPADLRKAIINAKDDKERLAIIENQKAGIRQRLENEAAGDKTADKLAKEAQGLADNKPAEKKFTLETIKSFDPRKHGHAYLSKISFNDRKPVREFIDSNTRMWDSKRKYYETSYTFNAKEGDMFEARLDDGSWKSDTKEYYIVKKDDKGELYLSKAKELSDLQKEAIKEAETKSEWKSKISSSTDAVKLNKIMRDIEHTEAITPNNRAKLYVAITNRLKELRKTER